MGDSEINPFGDDSLVEKPKSSYRKCSAICLDGHVCGRPAIDSYGRCEEHPRHGGMRPADGAKRTPEAARKRKKGYRDRLPLSLKDAYRKIAQSHDLMVLTEEIRLLQVRLDIIVGRLKTNESGESWARARNAFHMFRQCNTNGDIEGMRLYLETLSNELNAGNNDEVIWEEIEKLTLIKAKLVEQESKRNYRVGGVATAAQVESLVLTISRIIIDNVKDPEILARIKDEIKRIGVFDTNIAEPFPEESSPG